MDRDKSSGNCNVFRQLCSLADLVEDIGKMSAKKSDNHIIKFVNTDGERTEDFTAACSGLSYSEILLQKFDLLIIICQAFCKN